MIDFSTILFILLIIGGLVFFVASAFGGRLADDEVLEKAGKLLASGETKLVDVRTPREYAGNGLKGADNIPLQQLSRRLDEIGEKDQPVVLYCRSGHRSAQAANILREQGFEEIYDLGAHRTARKVVEDAC